MPKKNKGNKQKKKKQQQTRQKQSVNVRVNVDNSRKTRGRRPQQRPGYNPHAKAPVSGIPQPLITHIAPAGGTGTPNIKINTPPPPNNDKSDKLLDELFKANKQINDLTSEMASQRGNYMSPPVNFEDATYYDAYREAEENYQDDEQGTFIQSPQVDFNVPGPPLGTGFTFGSGRADEGDGAGIFDKGPEEQTLTGNLFDIPEEEKQQEAPAKKGRAGRPKIEKPEPAQIMGIDPLAGESKDQYFLRRHKERQAEAILNGWTIPDFNQSKKGYALAYNKRKK